ncbi:MAG: hypothetical protein IJ766_02225 [Clostridia bacterium]|nr:hypothetical protein [Clostridia bacterium]
MNEIFKFFGYRVGDYDFNGRQGKYLNIFVGSEHSGVTGMQTDKFKCTPELISVVDETLLNEDVALGFDRYGRVISISPC